MEGTISASRRVESTSVFEVTLSLTPDLERSVGTLRCAAPSARRCSHHLAKRVVRIDQASAIFRPHYPVMSRERVFEVTSEMRSLIKEQQAILSTGTTFFDMSVEDLTAYAARHARIEQLSTELKEMSFIPSHPIAAKSAFAN